MCTYLVSGLAYIPTRYIAKAHIFRHYDCEHALLCKHPITYYVSPTISFGVPNKLSPQIKVDRGKVGSKEVVFLV